MTKASTRALKALLWSSLAFASIYTCQQGCGVASAAPPTVQVYQDGGRVGEAPAVFNFIGPIRGNITNNAVRVSLDDAGTGGGTSFPTPPMCGVDAGSALGWDGGAFICQPAAPATFSFLSATYASGIGSSEGTYINKDDHLRFGAVINSGGSHITLDTATSYTAQNNVASIGRFTLTGGHCYRLTCIMSYVRFLGANTYLNAGWTYAATGAPVSLNGAVFIMVTGGGHEQGSGASDIIECPGSNTVYDFRLTARGTDTLAQIGGTSSQTADGGLVTAWPSAVIQELN